MAHDARAIANYFIKIAWDARFPLTHLALQKTLFFAHGWHLAKFNAPLIGQRFEAWQYGPVVRVVYDQLKGGKAVAIDQLLKKIDTATGRWVDAETNFSISECQFLQDLFSYYSRFHAGALVDLTHVEGGPWDRVWNKAVDNVVPGMIISNDEIKNWILRGGGGEGTVTH